MKKTAGFYKIEEAFEYMQRRKTMEYLNTAQELLDFIMRCKSPFHVVKEASDLLNENGYKTGGDKRMESRSGRKILCDEK